MGCRKVLVSAKHIFEKRSVLCQPGGLPERFGCIHIVWICVGVPASGFQQIDLIRSLDDVREAAAERLTQLLLLMLHIQRDNRFSGFKEV